MEAIVRRLFILAAILGLAALLVSCAGDEPAAPAAPAEEAAAAPSGDDSPTEAAEEPEPSASVGSFTEAGRMTDARMDHVTVLLGDGRVLTAGGRGRGATIRPPRLERAEVYDPATGEWTAVGEMSAKREVFCGVALSDGRAMIFGGADERREALKTTEILDPATGEWTLGT